MCVNARTGIREIRSLFRIGCRLWAGDVVAIAVSLSCICATAHAAVIVSQDATQNMSCSNGNCVPTATKAVLNVTDLENLLASGNVEVTTTGSGGVQARDIVIGAALTWSGASTLSLDAYRSITVDQPTSIAGPGALSLLTNDGGSGGMLSFGKKGNVQFASLSSALSIEGQSYTLVNSVASLASAVASDPGGSYAFANDYNASQDGTYADSPVTAVLTGTVQGLGNTIANLSIDSQNAKSNTGLFGDVGSSGAVEDFRLNGAEIAVPKKKEARSIGLLVGFNAGSLFGDEVSGIVAVSWCKLCAVGGLVGGNGGPIALSSASVRVSDSGSPALLGGLVGGNGGAIRLSHADGVVRGHQAGGLVGENVGGTIDQSFSTSRVRGADDGVLGGLVAYNDFNGSAATITNSYATGSVTGGAGTDAGGFVGKTNTDSTIGESYSTGAVSAGTGAQTGGFACDFDVPLNLNNNYWDTTTSGTNQGTCAGNVSGITGLTTEQLQSGLPAGFDPKIWAEGQNMNNGQPYLIANPPPK